MKRILLALTAALATLVFAAPAQAITTDYCNLSLGGGGSLAPDNDYYIGRRAIETNYSVNINYAYNTGWNQPHTDWLTVQRVYWATTGQRYYTQLICWRDINGTYHDRFDGVKYIQGN